MLLELRAKTLLCKVAFRVLHEFVNAPAGVVIHGRGRVGAKKWIPCRPAAGHHVAAAVGRPCVPETAVEQLGEP